MPFGCKPGDIMSKSLGSQSSRLVVWLRLSRRTFTSWIGAWDQNLMRPWSDRAKRSIEGRWCPWDMDERAFLHSREAKEPHIHTCLALRVTAMGAFPRQSFSDKGKTSSLLTSQTHRRCISRRHNPMAEALHWHRGPLFPSSIWDPSSARLRALLRLELRLSG